MIFDINITRDISKLSKISTRLKARVFNTTLNTFRCRLSDLRVSELASQVYKLAAELGKNEFPNFPRIRTSEATPKLGI